MLPISPRADAADLAAGLDAQQAAQRGRRPSGGTSSRTMASRSPIDAERRRR